MVAEDQAAFGGAHGCLIENTFANRGIGGDPTFVYLSGPYTLNLGEVGTWTANPICTSGPVSYEWTYQPEWNTQTYNWSTSQSATRAWYQGGGVYIKVVFTDEDGSVQRDRIVHVNDTRNGAEANALAGAAAAEALPEEFALKGSAPNPFRGQAEIHYALPEAAEVELVVYDVLGREVARPVDRRMPAGFHEAPFEAEGLPSGVYVYRLRAGAFEGSGRMVLVK